MINDGKQLEIEYTMTDPENWEGEWKSTKRFNRVDDEDIQEVSCLPDLNEHLQSTTSKTQVLQMNLTVTRSGIVAALVVLRAAGGGAGLRAGQFRRATGPAAITRISRTACQARSRATSAGCR